jgi:hypothetical protein
MAHTNDEHDLKQTATDEAREPRAEQHFSGPTPIEQQRSATAEPTPAIADAPENLDVDFDSPQLDLQIEREIKRSREALEEKLDALDHHIGQAAKNSILIRALIEGERD